MRRLYIIILNPNIDSSTVRRRIEELGDYYIIYDNQYLVLADFDSASDFYSRIIRKDDNEVGIVVLGTSMNELTYWGYADRNLWTWLREHKEQMGEQ